MDGAAARRAGRVGLEPAAVARAGAGAGTRACRDHGATRQCSRLAAAGSARHAGADPRRRTLPVPPGRRRVPEPRAAAARAPARLLPRVHGRHARLARPRRAPDRLRRRPAGGGLLHRRPLPQLPALRMERAVSARLPLGGMLADPAMAGAYLVDQREQEAYAEAAAMLGFAAAAVNFSGCRDKADALCRFARALRFPEWFGHNWDALADCLSDLSWMPADRYLLLLTGTDAWRRTDRESFDITLEVLEQAAEGWKAERVPFWALVLVDDPFAA